MERVLFLLLLICGAWVYLARHAPGRQASPSKKYFLSRVLLSLAAAPVLAQSRPAPLCRQLVLEGEVKQGLEWRASIGQAAGPHAQDWLIRLVPVASGKPSQAEISSGQVLSRGWDLAVSPASDQNYPDALLLASPPYSSLNSREIATTYGLRAQDTIAWSPRHFHFFTSVAGLARARPLYRTLLDAGSSAARRQQASTQLFDLTGVDPGTGSASLAGGRIEILDAHLLPGSADPAPFASQWAASFVRTPHTLDSDQGKSSPQGELHSLHFRITLWLPAAWKTPSRMGNALVKCAE